MAVVPVKDLAKGGLVKDTSPINLSENIFTDALNVRFRNSSVESMFGESTAFTLGSLAAEQAIHWRRPDVSYNVFAKDGTIIRRTAAGAETSLLSSGSYAGSKWQVDTFGGGYAIIFNNGVSTPLYALYNGGAADSAMQPFPGWNYIGGYTVTAKVIKAFGYSLVAANLTINDGVTTTYAPSTLRISVQAAIGGFPSIWQPGLTTDTADEFEVNTDSPIVDLAELRGSMMIYSSNTISVLSITNGNAAVRPYSRGHGILNQGCVAEFDNQHFVVDRNDIYIHNGSGQIKSAAEGRMRDYFLEDLNQVYSSSAFVVRNSRFKEIWVCYPDLTATSAVCNKALVYNYNGDTFTIRQLPNLKAIARVPEISGGAFRYGTEVMLGLSNATRIFQFDVGDQMFNTTTNLYADFTSMVERSKLGVDDPFGSNYIAGIAPLFETYDPDTVVSVFLSHQNTYDKTPAYTNVDGRELFTIAPKSDSQGYKVDPRTEGRFINLKIQSNQRWRLSFLGLDIVKSTARR
jgi:hypothetical protein